MRSRNSTTMGALLSSSGSTRSSRLGLIELAGALVPGRQRAHTGGPGQREGRQKGVEANFAGSVRGFARRRLANVTGEYERQNMRMYWMSDEEKPPLNRPVKSSASLSVNVAPYSAPLFSRLIEVDDAVPDEPMRGGHCGIHRAAGRLLGPGDDGGKRLLHPHRVSLVLGVCAPEQRCPCTPRW